MTRPQIIRAGQCGNLRASEYLDGVESTGCYQLHGRNYAEDTRHLDTIDLQNQDAPSAKDHTRQPTHPGPLGDGPPAPHQAVAMMNASHEPAEHYARSPRASQDLSGKELQLLHESPGSNDSEGDGGLHRDGYGFHRNGDSSGANGEDGDMGEAEDGDSLDDDMMDKISSSPSIDDGGYSLPPTWPSREDSLSSNSTAIAKEQSLFTTLEVLSSSPFLSTPAHYPLSLNQEEPDPWSSEVHHHEKGRYPGHHLDNYYIKDDCEDDLGDENRDLLTPLLSDQRMTYFSEEPQKMQDSYEEEFESDDLQHLLLPADDPLLDNSFDDVPLSQSPSELSPALSESSWDGRNVEKADDETGDVSLLNDSRFIDSGWGGECLRETEDIDFEFVYALHTFIATVEGQANATKGDTMVLLDDSNSYWWLVRVVKDSSIGYLPAEHIETPTERLARLNKHRNIDLSQTMLGDNPEKSKNPLKKAFGRRNAKTVQFTAPTYHDAPDIDYSTDEEDEDDDGLYPETVAATQVGSQEVHGERDQTAAVEPLQIGPQLKEHNDNDGIQSDLRSQKGSGESELTIEKPRTSEEIFDHQDNGLSVKSRNGLVRNTDSFFKDDTVETRKINLTPSLLRDDSSSSTLTPVSSEQKEIKSRGGSLDTLEKVASPPEKAKEEKRKEKKSGILSGLFKRKDRKGKAQSEDDDPEWLSKETSGQSPQPKISSESIPQDGGSLQSSPQQRQQPQRQISKLQKTPPVKMAPLYKRPSSREGQNPEKSKSSGLLKVAAPQSDQPSYILTEPDSAKHGEQVDTSQVSRSIPPALRIVSPEQPRERSSPPLSPVDSKRGNVFSPMRDVLRSSPSSSGPKPENVERAKDRMAMAEFDSSPDAEDVPDLMPPREEIYPNRTQEQSVKERLSESPIQVSPLGSTDHINAPALVGDTSSQEEPSISPVSPSSTPELVEAPREESIRDEKAPVSTVQSSTNAPSWSDASLRSYLEDDTDIRDLLVVVYDKSDIRPAGPDHHIVANLCKEENRRLGEMSTRLDGLLQAWLARKSKTVSR